MIADIIKGIFKYIEAISYIGRLGLGRYFFYSGLIGLVLMVVAGAAVFFAIPLMVSLITGFLPWDVSWLTDVSGVVSFLGGSVFFLLIFKYLMLIFTAPLMSKLSEEIEINISGVTGRKVGVYEMISEILRGARIALRNIIREVGVTLMLMLLGFVPVIGVVAAPLILVVQAYYAGFGNIDFWAERHYDFRNTVKYMKMNRGACIGNGLPYVFLLAIPVLGVFLAPPLATIAATLHAEAKRDF